MRKGILVHPKHTYVCLILSKRHGNGEYYFYFHLNILGK